MGKKEKKKKLDKQAAAKAKKQKKSDKRRKKDEAGSEQAPSGKKAELKREIKQLKSELQAREQLIDELRRPTPVENSAQASDLVALLEEGEKDSGLAASQRKCWEQHRYLRSQYEAHLENGSTKVQARSLADRDLRERYGDCSGFSTQELEEILS